MSRNGKARPGEFELIERFFRPLATAPGALRLTDDAALLQPPRGRDLVVTADMLAEGIHFRAADAPDSIARKALRVNLSDLAAKGAEPTGYLLALALPKDWSADWLASFARGLGEDQKRYGIALLGGDTTKAAGGLTIAITAIGSVPKGRMIYRSGARAGDAIYVSGTIGDSALGLALLQGAKANGLSRRERDALADRYLHPQPRLGLVPALRRHARAALDVSDGLVADLGHICSTSDVGARIEAGRVPLSPAARSAVSGSPALIATILSGGDDYEILSAISPEHTGGFERAAAKAAVPVTRIGEFLQKKGSPVVIGADGKPLRLVSAGFTHF